MWKLLLTSTCCSTNVSRIHKPPIEYSPDPNADQDVVDDKMETDPEVLETKERYRKKERNARFVSNAGGSSEIWVDLSIEDREDRKYGDQAEAVKTYGANRETAQAQDTVMASTEEESIHGQESFARGES